MVDIDIASTDDVETAEQTAIEESEGYTDTEIAAHTSDDVHNANQPPQSHDNEAHDRDLVDAVEAADAAPVQSVNSQEGTVNLDSGDVGATSDTDFTGHDHSGSNGEPDELNPSSVVADDRLDPPTVGTRDDIPNDQTGLYYVEDEDTLTLRT